MLSPTNNKSSHFKIFIAVIIAVIIVLILAVSFMALVLANISAPKSGNNLTLPKLQGQTSRGQNAAAASAGQNNISVAPATRFDHVRGSLSAPISIIEFADLECPFCKEFHSVLRQIVTAYPNKVNWVFRHFPIDSLHTKARAEAEAAECAAELGGNNKFWQYIDAVFAVTPSNDGLDPEQLPAVAAQIGLNRQNFLACLSSGKYAPKIANDLGQAILAGGSAGTPYSVIIIGGEKIPVSGAISYGQLKAAVDALLAELERRK